MPKLNIINKTLMEKNKISEVVTDLLFDKFLLNFAPGIILLFAVMLLTPFSAGDGITSVLIITVGAWTLGALVEIIFFPKSSVKRRESGNFTIAHKLNLLLGKIGLAIVITCVLSVVAAALNDEFYDYNYGSNSSEKESFERSMITNTIFFAFGFCMVFIYKRRSNQMN